MVAQVIRIAVMVSGGGSNLKALVQKLQEVGENKKQPVTNTNLSTNNALSASIPHIIISAVIADRDCTAINFASQQDIATYVYGKKNYEHIDSTLQMLAPDIIVLAGFLGILPTWFTKMWSGKIINIHPSLLPKFGGKGMYGLNVHKEVLAQKEQESGCTVHWVIDKIDGGDIIAQAKVQVLESDSPEQLQQRVLIAEHSLYPEVVLKLAQKIADTKYMNLRESR